MTLIDWLRQKLNSFSPTHPTRRRNRLIHRNDYHKRKRVTEETSNVNESNETSRPQQPEQSAHGEATAAPTQETPVKSSSTTETRPQSQITIFYLDENNNEIKPADILTGFSGDRLHFQFPNFDDYFITAIDDFTSHFEDDNQEITVHYELMQGHPVLIYSIDTDTGSILQSVKILRDQLGKRYAVQATSIPDYRLISSTGNTLGHFNQEIQQVIFSYRNANWKTVQPVTYYVKLLNHHDVYNEPAGRSLRTGLPENLIIKIFAQVVTGDDNSWLNIGGFEWIKNEHLQPSDPPAHIVAGPITKTSRNPVRLFGTINFIPNQPITTYDSPYGNKVGELMHGSRISIVATIVDDQDLIWYELANHTVVPRTYIDVDK